MDKNVVIAQKEDRLNKIIGRGKKSSGVIQKLQRELRNLTK